MKSDARLLLNKRKWKNASGPQKNAFKSDSWIKRGSTVDARKILNLKRGQKSKPPTVGSYMRTKTATSLIASQIKKEISTVNQMPDKRVKLSKDGNIIITSKSNNTSRLPGSSSVVARSDVALRSRIFGNTMDYEPSTIDMDDLEETGMQDLLDFDALPSALVSSNSLQNANLSRNSVISRVLDNRHTMVADQLSQASAAVSAKVHVSNLHPTVSRQDVMELFGDVGAIKNAELLRPGAAVINFYNADDAEKACEIYHNRLLDGLPMKCVMQTNDQPKRPAISQRLGRFVAPSSSVIREPVTSVISTNPRSRYNPRNVQFTVKLT